MKLLDYEDRWEELERSTNPFAAVVMAHLKTQATRRRPESRLEWKVRILRCLYREGRTREEFADLFRFIDLVMRLPSDLELVCEEEIRRYEEEQKMPLVSPWEQRAMARGHDQGVLENAREAVAEVLTLRFGDVPPSLAEQVEQLDDPAELKNLLRRATTADSLDEFEMELAECCVAK